METKENVFDGDELLRQFNNVVNPDGSTGMVEPSGETAVPERSAPVRGSRTKAAGRPPRMKVEEGVGVHWSVKVKPEVKRRISLLVSAGKHSGRSETVSEILGEAVGLLMRKRKNEIERYREDILDI